MIFSPELAAKVIAGEKTVTRRVAREEESCRYKVGRTYAVQPGRGKHAIGRIRVLTVDRQRMTVNLTDAELRREGFTHLDEFIDYWRRLHDNIGMWVWRIRFEVA